MQTHFDARLDRIEGMLLQHSMRLPYRKYARKIKLIWVPTKHIYRIKLSCV